MSLYFFPSLLKVKTSLLASSLTKFWWVIVLLLGFTGYLGCSVTKELNNSQLLNDTLKSQFSAKVGELESQTRITHDSLNKLIEKSIIQTQALDEDRKQFTNYFASISSSLSAGFVKTASDMIVISKLKQAELDSSLARMIRDSMAIFQLKSQVQAEIDQSKLQQKDGALVLQNFKSKLDSILRKFNSNPEYFLISPLPDERQSIRANVSISYKEIEADNTLSKVEVSSSFKRKPILSIPIAVKDSDYTFNCDGSKYSLRITSVYPEAKRRSGSAQFVLSLASD